MGKGKIVWGVGMREGIGWNCQKLGKFIIERYILGCDASGGFEL